MKKSAQTAKGIAFLLVLGMLLASLTAFSEHAPWDCPEPGCGRTGNRGNYCGYCGHPAPWMTWDCPECGQKGNTDNYCSNCAHPSPRLEEEQRIKEETWDCPQCGKEGNTGNFCSHCAYPRPSVTAMSKLKVTVGQYLTYGHYEQDNNIGNGKEPIEWLVLDYDANTNSALLISRFGLDARAYEPGDGLTAYPAWEKSDIRRWLNGTFLNEAFTAAEQTGIVTTTVRTPSYKGYSGGAVSQDQIWLLSREEAEKYFTSLASRKTSPTAYAVARGAWQYSGRESQYKVNDEGCCWWWLRSPGGDGNSASYVLYDGSLISIEVGYTGNAVRPAFWLDMD